MMASECTINIDLARPPKWLFPQGKRGVEYPQNLGNLSAEIGASEPARPWPVHPSIHVGARGGHNGEWGEAVNSNTSENFSPFYSGSEREQTQKRPRSRAHFCPISERYPFSRQLLLLENGEWGYLQKGVEEEEEEEEENEQVYLSFARAQADTHSRR